jgi:Carboxypeptidase regulatory-like domain/Bacterial Ig-like domain (group 2)
VKRVTLASIVVLFVPACSGRTATAPTSSSTNPTAPAVVRITVVGATPAVGGASQWSASATFTDATTQDVTERAQWRSSATAVATVSATGMVTAIAPGDADITATVDSIVGTRRASVSAPAPVRYTLTGVISDMTSRGGVPNARVEVTNGMNAGMAVTTDAAGVYSIQGLSADTFRLRASASGYDAGEQNVTVPANARADFLLQRANTCTYTVNPSSLYVSSGGFAYPDIVTVDTQPGCGWTAATGADWLFFAAGGGSYVHSVAANGAGDVRVASNASSCYRTSRITIRWTGGGLDVAVEQGLGKPVCAQAQD